MGPSTGLRHGLRSSSGLPELWATGFLWWQVLVLTQGVKMLAFAANCVILVLKTLRGGVSQLTGRGAAGDEAEEEGEEEEEEQEEEVEEDEEEMVTASSEGRSAAKVKRKWGSD